MKKKNKAAVKKWYLDFKMEEDKVYLLVCRASATLQIIKEGLNLGAAEIYERNYYIFPNKKDNVVFHGTLLENNHVETLDDIRHRLQPPFDKVLLINWTVPVEGCILIQSLDDLSREVEIDERARRHMREIFIVEDIYVDIVHVIQFFADHQQQRAPKRTIMDDNEYWVKRLKMAAENEKEIKPVNDDDECVVCVERGKTAVLLPCSHQCMCATCAIELLKKTDGICPICREPIDNVVCPIK